MVAFFEQIDSFDGIEVAAIIKEFKYLFDVGLSNIKKVAVLTDKKWIESVAKIESKLFTGVQVRCFLTDDQSSSYFFLKSLLVWLTGMKLLSGAARYFFKPAHITDT